LRPRRCAAARPGLTGQPAPARPCRSQRGPALCQCDAGPAPERRAASAERNHLHATSLLALALPPPRPPAMAADAATGSSSPPRAAPL
jgi:hypothetical protein